MTQNIRCYFWPGHCVPDIHDCCHECGEPCGPRPKTWGTAPKGALSLVPEGIGELSLPPGGELSKTEDT